MNPVDEEEAELIIGALVYLIKSIQTVSITIRIVSEIRSHPTYNLTQ